MCVCVYMTKVNKCVLPLRGKRKNMRNVKETKRLKISLFTNQRHNDTHLPNENTIHRRSISNLCPTQEENYERQQIRS